MPLASSVTFKNKGNLHTYKTYSLRSNVAVSSDRIQKQCSSTDHKPRGHHVYSLVKSNTFVCQYENTAVFCSGFYSDSVVEQINRYSYFNDNLINFLLHKYNEMQN